MEDLTKGQQLDALLWEIVDDVARALISHGFKDEDDIPWPDDPADEDEDEAAWQSEEGHLGRWRLLRAWQRVCVDLDQDTMHVVVSIKDEPDGPTEQHDPRYIDPDEVAKWVNDHYTSRLEGA